LKDLDEQDLFGKIWIQNVRDIDYKVISSTEDTDKFQRTRFWKEKSGEDVVTQATLVHIKITFTPFSGPSSYKTFLQSCDNILGETFVLMITLMFLLNFKDGIFSCFMNHYCWNMITS
jgi:hypothetical protein